MPRFRLQSQAAVTAATYGLFAFLWILFSDWLLAAIVDDLPTLSLLQTFKGWFFVAVTTALVYSLVHRQVAQILGAEMDLHASEERYRAVVEGTDDLITQVDGEGRFTFVNRRASTILGLPPSECMGLSAFDFVHPEDRERTRAWFEECLGRKATSDSIENRQVARDGKVTWMLWTVNFRYGPAGALEGVQAIARDITDRKFDEDLLAYQKSLLEAQQQASPNGILVADEKGSIRFWNKRFLSIWNLTGKSLARNDLSWLMELWARQTLEPDALTGQLRQFLDRRDEFPFSCPLTLRDGRSIELYSRRLFGQPGNYQGPAFFFSDVTKARLAEKTLQENLRIKTEFISMAAHELRTPLASVMGFSEMLLNASQMGGFDLDRQREFISIIHKKSENLSKIVDDLLDLNRIDTGQEIRFDMVPCDMGDLAAKAVADFRVRFPSREISLELAAGGSDCILADPDRMEQVLENLIDNALKYSPEGEKVAVSCGVADGAYRLAVSDKGKGMSSETASRVFDKFYRGDPSDTGISGMGLGLSIVKHIVEKHGGWMEIDTAIGKGTTFTVVIPSPELRRAAK